MKQIELTQGKTALVDDENYSGLNRFKWHALKDNNTFYAARKIYMPDGRWIMLRMHHLVVGKPMYGFQVDHIDGNGINNQKRNLRIVTHRQNLQNKIGSNPTSQHPGVDWNKKSKKWRSRITIEGKCMYLGLFDKEQEAADIYMKALGKIGETFVELIGVKPRTEQRTIKYWLIVWNSGEVTFCHRESLLHDYVTAQQVIPLTHTFDFTLPEETLHPVVGKILDDFEKGNHG